MISISFAVNLTFIRLERKRVFAFISAFWLVSLLIHSLASLYNGRLPLTCETQTVQVRQPSLATGHAELYCGHGEARNAGGDNGVEPEERSKAAAAAKHADYEP
jgi:hypothetical protein